LDQRRRRSTIPIGGAGDGWWAEAAGTLIASGQQAAAAFVSVLRVRAGRIVHWREYQNPLAMAAVAVQRVSVDSGQEHAGVTG
jgi:ketosteroid isomerase-like protein